MKISKEAKQFLLSIGYRETDFAQIEEATTKTIYKFKGKLIGVRKAKKLLGTKRFWASIGRSAFHWTTSCEVDGTNSCVSFDSSKLFK